MEETKKSQKEPMRTTQQYSQLSCFHCNLPSSDERRLLSCSRCKRTKYCSSDCQRKDFPSHSSFCKAWAKLRPSPASLDNFPSLPSSSLDQVLSHMASSTIAPLEISMADKFTPAANFLAFKEARCGACYRLDGQQDTKLAFCRDCRVFAWCSGRDECRAVAEQGHVKEGICSTLREINIDEAFLYLYERDPMSPGAVVPWAPDRILNKPVTLPSSWDDYFKSVDAPFLSLEASTVFERTMARHSMSLPLTLLAALERLGISSRYGDLSNRSTLTVHLVGAESAYEAEVGGMAFEEVLHALPGVKELRLVMVGPRMRVGEGEGVVIDMGCCPTCTASGRGRTVQTYNAAYHDFLRARPNLPQPDLCVGFNSGLHEQLKSWAPTLGVLIASKVPCVFTSYNRTEAEVDALAVRRKAGAGAEMLWQVEPHVWAGGRKRFDLFTESPHFWCDNAYWMAFKGI